MLLDTRTMKAIEAREERDDCQGLDYTPSEYERDKKVFVFRMTWEGEDEGDLLNFADALEFVATMEDEWADLYAKFTDMPEEEREAYFVEARAMLDSERGFRIGPDEDWYRITPLSQPMTHDRWGELVTLDGFEETNRIEAPFDCVAGVDFPASLNR